MRIFMWSPYSTWQVHAVQEFTIARALQLRGAEVQIWLCDSLFPECDIYTRPGLGLGEGSRPENLCQFCQCRAMEMACNTAAPVKWLGRHVPHDIPDRASAWAMRLKVEELLDAHWDGQPIGTWMSSSAFSQLRLSNICIEDPDVQALYRRNLIGAVIAYEGLRRAMDAQQPDAMLTFNGRFFPHRVAVELARQRGIPFLTHERGAKKEHLMVRENYMVH